MTRTTAAPSGSGSGGATRFLSGYGTRLAASYVGLIVLAGVLVGLFLYHGEKDVFVDFLVDDLARTARVAGSGVNSGQSPETLAALAREVSRLTGARVTLIARDGRVLADSEADPSSMENHADRPEVRTALRGRTGVSIRRSATLGSEMLYVAVMTGDGVVTRLSLDMAFVSAALARFRSTTLVPFLTVCLLAVAVALRSAGRITGPLREMSEVAREMARGNLQVRAPVDGPREAAELGASLNHLASALQARMAEVDTARRHLETLVTGLPSGVLEVSRDYTITGANPAAERILGFRLEDVRDRHYSTLFRSYPLTQALGAALERGESSRLEVETGRGPDSAVHISISPLRDASERLLGAVLVFEDLGPTRRDARVRRELVANVSHELKTPVASIKALSETLAAGAMDEPETAARFLAHIARESDRLERLVKDLLELAKLESCEARLERAPVGLNSLVSRVAERFRPAMEQKGVTLVIHLPEVELTVSGDEHYLERALGNLLDNAVKFTPSGGRVTVDLAGPPAVGKDPGGRPWAEISVTDTGPGLGPEAVPRVFERFYRADADRSREAGGTGLGLAIVKHVVQAHGGTVGVRSGGPGTGCCFWMRLPLD